MKYLITIFTLLTFISLFSVEKGQEAPLVDPNKTTYCYLSLGSSIFEENHRESSYNVAFLEQVGLGCRSLYSTENYIDTIDCSIAFHNVFKSDSPLKISIFPQISFLSHFWKRFPKLYVGCGVAKAMLAYKKLYKEYFKNYPVKYIKDNKSLSFIPCFVLGYTRVRTSTFIEFIELKMYLWENDGSVKHNPFINISCNYGF